MSNDPRNVVNLSAYREAQEDDREGYAHSARREFGLLDGVAYCAFFVAAIPLVALLCVAFVLSPLVMLAQRWKR